MDPSIPRQPAMDPAEQLEARRYVDNAKKLLAVGNPELSWPLLVYDLTVDPCAPLADILLVAATALRAAQRQRLPCGAPDPYSVFGLIPTVLAARNPGFIKTLYRRASDVLNRIGPHDPCAPAFAQAARLVADA